MSYVVDFEDLPTQELNFLWETVLLCVCVFYCVSFSLSLVTDENAHCFEEEEGVPFNLPYIHTGDLNYIITRQQRSSMFL